MKNAVFAAGYAAFVAVRDKVEARAANIEALEVEQAGIRAKNERMTSNLQELETKLNATATRVAETNQGLAATRTATANLLAEAGTQANSLVAEGHAVKSSLIREGQKEAQQRVEKADAEIANNRAKAEAELQKIHADIRAAKSRWNSILATAENITK